MSVRDPGKLRFLVFARGDWGVRDPGKPLFLVFARGGWGAHDPGKSCFLDFTRGDWGALDPGKARFLSVCQGHFATFHLGKTDLLRQFMVIYLFSITAPSAPFPAALSLNRAAIFTPNGAPLQSRRHLHSQRSSASSSPHLAEHRVGSVTLRRLQEYSGCQDDATEYY